MDVLSLQLCQLLLQVLIEFDDASYHSFVLGHKELLRFDLEPQLVFHRLRSVSVQNQITKDKFVLVVLLLIKLQHVLLPIQVFFKFLNFILQSFLVFFLLFLHIIVDLRQNQDFGVKQFSLMIKVGDVVLELVDFFGVKGMNALLEVFVVV